MGEALGDGDARVVVVGDVVEARREDEDARERVQDDDGERVDPGGAQRPRLQGDGAGAGSGVIGDGDGAVVGGVAEPGFGMSDFSFSRF